MSLALKAENESQTEGNKEAYITYFELKPK